MMHFFSRHSASGTLVPVPLEDIGPDGPPLLGIIKALCKRSCHTLSLPIHGAGDGCDYSHPPPKKVNGFLHSQSISIVILYSL